jgi:lactoylglutathione lyase
VHQGCAGWVGAEQPLANILGRMTTRFAHTCIRVLDVDRSIEFYEWLGFEPRGRLNFESAYNVYLGLPGGGDVLELTVNVGRDKPYDLGDGYNHMALVVSDLDGLLESLAAHGVAPEKPPYRVGGTDSRQEYRICFVADPDGYRIELIDGAFPTPQDPPHPSTRNA